MTCGKDKGKRLATVLLDLNRQDAATFARDVSLEMRGAANAADSASPIDQMKSE
jgi:hypothetical protein